MKTLVLPILMDDEITLDKITSSFKGLVIGYKDNKPICYIQYCTKQERWFVYNTINDKSIVLASPLIINDFSKGVITMVKNKTVDVFKVLEFGN